MFENRKYLLTYETIMLEKKKVLTIKLMCYLLFLWFVCFVGHIQPLMWFAHLAVGCSGLYYITIDYQLSKFNFVEVK